MKKHNNTFKRVAASAVSMLTVAGMMPANVGGFLTGGNAIVAYADEAPVVQIDQYVNVASVKDYIKSVKIGDTEIGKSEVVAKGGKLEGKAKADGGKVVISSIIPLDFEGVITYGNVDPTKYAYSDDLGGWYEVSDSNDNFIVPDGIVIMETLGRAFDDNIDYVLNNDGSIISYTNSAVTTTNADLKNGFTYEIAAVDGIAINAMKYAAYNFNEEAEPNIYLEKEYLVSMNVVGKDGETDEVTKFGRNAIYAYEAKFGDVITLESKSLLTFNYNDNTYNNLYDAPKFYEVNEAGNYVYKFIVADTNMNIEIAKADLIVPDGATVKNNFNNNVISVADDDTNADVYANLVAGLNYTVTVSGITAENSLNNDAKLNVVSAPIVKDKNAQGQETGTKTYSTSFTLGYDVVTFEIGPHIHQRVYTVDGNKVNVKCTAPEGDLDAVAAEVTLDFGYTDPEKETETNPIGWVSTKSQGGSFVFDTKSAVKTNVSIKDTNASDAVVETYLADPDIKYYKVNKDGTTTELTAAPKDAGDYKVVVTFTKTDKDGMPDNGEGSTIAVEQTFTILPASVNTGRVKFFVNGTEYAINKTTGTYQIFSTGSVITPVIWVDGVAVNNYNEESLYYATGATSAKYPGLNEINLTSKDSNNSTGDDDLTVKWEIITEPNVKLSSFWMYYGEDVVEKTKAHINANTAYELRFAEGYNYTGNEYASKAEFDAAKPASDEEHLPSNAGEYTVYVKYTRNQADVYKKTRMYIDPMPIKVVAEGYTEQLNYGDKQTAVKAKVVDANNNDITKQFIQGFSFTVYTTYGDNVGKYNPENKYNVGSYKIMVDNINTLGTGNSNYVVRDDWTGEAGRFTVSPAVVSTDFTSFIIPTINATEDYYRITEADIAAAYNAFSDNKPAAMTAADVEVVGGVVTGKNVTNRGYSVIVDFKRNFRTEDGEPVQLTWAIGSMDTVQLESFKPQYNEELKACTVVAKVKKLDTNAAVKEWGLVYDNKGLISSEATKAEFVAALKKDFGTSNYKYKRTKASAENKDELNVIMANSFINRKVYSMAYVIYEDGTVKFDEANAASANYFDLVYSGLKITGESINYKAKKTDTATTPCVLLDVKREEAKGYEVTDFGYIYNNSGNLTSVEAADSWVVFGSTDKNMKTRRPENGAATEFTGVIANSKYVNGVKVYAKAFVTVKDKGGNTFTYVTKINNSNGVFQYNQAAATEYIGEEH